MLARNNMFKPEALEFGAFADHQSVPRFEHPTEGMKYPFRDLQVTSSVPHLGKAFTDVQELKQAWLGFLPCFQQQPSTKMLYLDMDRFHECPGGLWWHQHHPQVPPSLLAPICGDDGFSALAALEASWETFVNHES